MPDDPLAWMRSLAPSAASTPPAPAPAPAEPATPTAAPEGDSLGWMRTLAQPAEAPRVAPVDHGEDAPPEPTPGVLGAMGQGLLRGAMQGPRGVAQTARVFAGERGAEPVPEDRSSFGRLMAKPHSQVAWSEYAPWLSGKISEALAGSAPTVVGAIGGAAAGSAMAGPAGALAGGAAGGGVGAALQTLGPAYQRALAEGRTTDQAVDLALRETGLAGLFGAAGGAIGAGLRGSVTKALVDIFGAQPALSVGQTAATNLATGRPNTRDELIESGVVGAGTGLAFEVPGTARAGLRRNAAAPQVVQDAAAGMQRDISQAQQEQPAPVASEAAASGQAQEAPPTTPALPPTAARPTGLGRGISDLMAEPQGQVGSGRGVDAVLSGAPSSPRSARAGQPYETFTPTGRAVEVRPRVVELDTLVPSHTDDFAVNPAFPHEEGVQPRDRSRPASQQQVQRLAATLQPERLGPSPEAGSGAPIVGPQGVVESGNGRVMALRRVYGDPAHAERADAYREWLARQGYDVSGMRRPVLVAQRQGAMSHADRAAFVREANAEPQASLSATEQAKSDATLAAEAMPHLRAGDVDSAANAGFVRAFIGSLPQTAQGRMIAADGSLSSEGIRRVRGAVLAHAYGEHMGPLLDRVVEADAEGIKAVAGALQDVAPAWAEMREAALRGEIAASADATPSLLEAVQLLDEGRRLGLLGKNKPGLGQLLRQQDMERAAPSPEALAFLRALFHDPEMRRPLGRDALSGRLAAYADEAMKSQAGIDMLGAPPPSAEQLIQAASRREERGPQAGERLQFSRRPEQPPLMRDDKRQVELPGAERNDQQALQARADAPMRGKVPQKGTEDWGVFDRGRQQLKLFSPRPAETAAAERHAARLPDASAVPAGTAQARVRLEAELRALGRYLGVPERVSIHLVDRIAEGRADAVYERGTDAVHGMVRFALDTDAEKAPFRFFHDFVHALMDPQVSPLSEEQRKTLRMAAETWMRQPFSSNLLRPGAEWTAARAAEFDTMRDALVALNRNIDAGTPKGREALIEEAIAHLGERHLAESLTPRIGFSQVLHRGIDYARGLRQALRGEGFQTSEAVFRGILQGRHSDGAARQELQRLVQPARGFPVRVPASGTQAPAEREQAAGMAAARQAGTGDLAGAVRELGAAPERYFSGRVEDAPILLRPVIRDVMRRLFSAAPGAEQYRATIQAYFSGKLPEQRGPIILGGMPSVLTRVGAPSRPLGIAPAKINKIKNEHQISNRLFELLPELLADPVAVFKNPSEGEFLTILGVRQGGAPVVAVVDWDKENRSFVRTVYAKDQNPGAYFERLRLAGDMLYVDEARYPVQAGGEAPIASVVPAEPSSGAREPKPILTKVQYVNENIAARQLKDRGSTSLRSARVDTLTDPEGRPITARYVAGERPLSAAQLLDAIEGMTGRGVKAETSPERQGSVFIPDQAPFGRPEVLRAATVRVRDKGDAATLAHEMGHLGQAVTHGPHMDPPRQNVLDQLRAYGGGRLREFLDRYPPSEHPAEMFAEAVAEYARAPGKLKRGAPAVAKWVRDTLNDSAVRQWVQFNVLPAMVAGAAAAPLFSGRGDLARRSFIRGTLGAAAASAMPRDTDANNPPIPRHTDAASDREGRPITAPRVAGVRRDGGPDVALTAADLIKAIEGMTGKPVVYDAATVQRLIDRGAMGETDWRPGEGAAGAQVSIRGPRHTVPLAHEMGHVGHLEALGEHVTAPPDVVAEWRREWPNKFRARRDGYPANRLGAELFADSVAHYAVDPEETKRTMPETAKWVRDTLNGNPVVSRHVQFNSLREDQLRHGLPGFYSAVERTVDEKLPARGPAMAILNTLRNAPGVKPEEMTWLGVDRWLASLGTQAVTRQQVAEFVRSNNLGVREVVKGAPVEALEVAAKRARFQELVDRDERGETLAPEENAETNRLATELQDVPNPWLSGDAQTRYAQYQLPGGENYREVLLTLPAPETLDATARRMGHAGWNSRLSEADRYAVIEESDRARAKSGRSEPYHSSHWEEPNVLAHIRMNERTDAEGRRTLLIEEVQSDWHQAGRKQGYRQEQERQHAELVAKHDALPPGPERDAVAAEAQRLMASEAGVPDAPFKTSWPILAMKRMIRWAAENNFDRVAWVPGDAQAARYDLSKQIAEVQLHGSGDNLRLSATDHQGRRVIDMQHTTSAALPDLVGKEVAEKLLAQPEPTGPYGSRRLEGLDLKVGGEGMRGFYDRMLPAEVNKLVKRFGARVEAGQVPAEEATEGWGVRYSDGEFERMPSREAAEGSLRMAIRVDPGATLVDPGAAPVHSLTITPALRDAALNDGFPLFSLRADAEAAGRELERAKTGLRDMLASVAPMTGGTERSRTVAARFANALRGVQYRYGEIDRLITKTFTAQQREAMGRAIDEQSVFEQVLARDLAAMPEAERAAHAQQARSEFERDGGGISALPPQARAVAEQLDQLAQTTWQRMQQREMVPPDAKGLPSYMPRMFVAWQDGRFVRPGSGGEGPQPMRPIGTNLTTRGPGFRKHLTAAETEAAGKAKLGDNAHLVRDVRALPLALSRNERAIAGHDLVTALKRMSDGAGVPLVRQGDLFPEDRQGFFTIDHPALRVWRPALERTPEGGMVAKLDAEGRPVMVPDQLHIAEEFRQPLEAVLSSPSGAIVKALMKVKGGVMHAIMWSPAMHLMVEVGRTLPLYASRPWRMIPMLPGNVWHRGNALLADRRAMDTAIAAGLAPIARGWSLDANAVADESAMRPIPDGTLARVAQQAGERWRGIGKAISMPADAAGAHGLARWLEDAWANPHRTLLWDNVLRLQAGIYSHARENYLGKGYAAEAASVMAAHLANRYAGALPPETMSKWANTAANLALFSRSFTLGNMGVMKDVLTGAPQYIVDQIAAVAGRAEATRAKADLRRKAMGAFIMDIGAFLLIGAATQNAIQLLTTDDTLDDVAKGYARRLQDMLHDYGEHPSELLNPLLPMDMAQRLSPLYDNEPGKQERIFAGLNSEGRGVYLRTPLGKVGEEFAGYLTNTRQLAINKTSTLLRPAMELLMGQDTLGRPILRRDAETFGERLENIGRAVTHIVGAQVPLDFLTAIKEKAAGTEAGYPLASWGRILGPLTGVAQISQGYPGGPHEGVRHAAAERVHMDRAEVMPQARRLIQRGMPDEARALLERAGLPPRDVAAALRGMQYPQAGEAARRRQFLRRATEEERERLGNVTGGRRDGYAEGGQVSGYFGAMLPTPEQAAQREPRPSIVGGAVRDTMQGLIDAGEGIGRYAGLLPEGAHTELGDVRGGQLHDIARGIAAFALPAGAVSHGSRLARVATSLAPRLEEVVAAAPPIASAAEVPAELSAMDRAFIAARHREALSASPVPRRGEAGPPLTPEQRAYRAQMQTRQRARTEYQDMLARMNAPLPPRQAEEIARNIAAKYGIPVAMLLGADDGFADGGEVPEQVPPGIEATAHAWNALASHARGDGIAAARPLPPEAKPVLDGLMHDAAARGAHQAMAMWRAAGDVPRFGISAITRS